MKKIRWIIHPLFLCLGLSFWLRGEGNLFLRLMLLSATQEAGKVLFCSSRGMRWKKIIFTPLGLRVEMEDGGELAFRSRLLSFCTGSLSGLMTAIFLFALEDRGGAYLSFLLACLRFLPFLPLDGGNLVLLCLGRQFGTLRMAGYLTKAAIGIGYGCMAFGMVYAALFPFESFFLFAGAYLIYANKREFERTADRFYLGLMEEGEKPFRRQRATGKETPYELALRLNPYEEAVFLRKDEQGISQQRVLLAVFTGKDCRWMWQGMAKREKDLRANTAVFGYDVDERAKSR